jgi:sulfur relay (sulfurtransferase) complex TusBCD TusD component (DsrE family)
MERRLMLSRFAALPLLASLSAAGPAVDQKRWPPLAEVLDKVVCKKIQIYACGTCSRARSVTDGDLAPWNAKFGNPAIFVSLVEWADRVITE